MAYEFHQTRLRNINFRGKDLTGANFSHTDIRGADFTNAILTGANFSHAKAGLSTSKTIAFVIFVLVVSLFAGLLAGYAGAFIGDLLSHTSDAANVFGIIVLITLLALFIVISGYGLGITLAILTTLVSTILVVALALFPENEASNNLVIGAVFSTFALAGMLTGLMNMAVAVAVARIMALPAPRTCTTFTALIGVLFGVLLGVREHFSTWITAGSLAIVTIIFGIYIGWLAIAGNKKYSLIKDLAVGIVASGGTKFCGANLTDADFTEATLKSVDLRQANLTRTCWFQVGHLENARLDSTYLKNPTIRQLLITKDGRDRSFDSLKLRGLNLKNANLQDAGFIGTDLSESTLENANLSGAKLARSQLYQTNLNHACLTGAYIPNWGISTDTQLKNIKCEYIYTQLPTKDDPDPCRKPDNRQETFKPGDFTDFIAPIIKTLDLYKTQNADPRKLGSKFKTLDLLHYEGIDPTAAAIAIIQLAEQNPDAGVQIVALEGRGEEKIRLQARVAGNANTSELNREYFEKYTEIQSLPYSNLQELIIGIKEKDEQISYLKNLLENAIHQPKFYVETINSQGDLAMSGSKGNISIGSAQGNISGLAATGENASMTGVAMGDVSGTVTNAINQLPNSPEKEEPGIKQLLQELQIAIETDSNLSSEDKAEAREQVENLVAASQNLEDAATPKKIKKAVTFLKGIISDLPATAKLVTTCNQLLPLISDRLANNDNQHNSAPANSIKIMLLASDPTDATRLRLGQELRDIQERLQLAKQRERFVLQQQMSVRPRDISQALLEFAPMIVHFSGHGTTTGELCFENEVGKVQPVKPEALAGLFALVNQQVKCVVLNACYSEIQAKSIAEHIQFVIGMNKAIGDRAAIAFAVGFYTAIGADRPIPEAYQFGCTQIQLEGIPESLTPVLYQKAG
jgi:uncharacterized protein YjbI with pentapeptide repeats